MMDAKKKTSNVLKCFFSLLHTPWPWQRPDLFVLAFTLRYSIALFLSPSIPVCKIIPAAKIPGPSNLERQTLEEGIIHTNSGLGACLHKVDDGMIDSKWLATLDLPGRPPTITL